MKAFRKWGKYVLLAMLVIALFIAISDIISKSYASRFSWALVFVCIWVWIIWSIFASRESDRARARGLDNYTFSFSKTNDFLHGQLGEEITGFLGKYKMGECVFERDIVERGIRYAMDDYCSRHKTVDPEE